MEQRMEIWVMDSDICEECGGLIGDFGICEDCGSDGIDYDDLDEEDNFEEDEDITPV